MGTKKGVDVIIEDLSGHPCCPHGPTILFARIVKGERKHFFACAAYRERKHCNFFLWENERDRLSHLKMDKRKQEIKELLNKVNHRKKFVTLNKINSLPLSNRIYCSSCQQFVLKNRDTHESHTLIKGITDYQLNHPSEIMPSLEDTKREAQYLFSKSAVIDIVNIFRDLQYRNVICVGTPRIHEYIRNSCNDMKSILLDIDRRFHDFFGPLEYCWYNLFNHHFFFNEARDVFKEFLKSDKANGTVLVTDPPFGGRVESVAFTLSNISSEYKRLNKVDCDLPIFWIFPYFMEPQILNHLPSFKMLDYKVDYENHLLFHDGPKGRKYGSPVRIFSNIDPGLIKLPEDNYNFCKLCNRWVAKNNTHCSFCKACPSKDGRTYIHCFDCKKCVKPTWKHCKNCNRCAQIDHKCELIEFTKNCFHCKAPGHKRSECPQLNKPSGVKRKGCNT
ncbi:hypothetical protein NQ317_000237, partial [Molorchus minor]